MKQITLIFTFILLAFVGHAWLDNNTSCHEIIRYHLEFSLMQDLGLKVKDLAENEKALLHLTNGIKVVEINNGKTRHITQIRVGFIILKANNIPIHSSEQFHEILSRQNECSVMLEGIYEGSATLHHYAFELD